MIDEEYDNIVSFILRFMKRHLLKFLLSLVRALVMVKRFFVWFLLFLGKVLTWVFRPALPFVVVPLYQVGRRLVRRYHELSGNPWERRVLVLLSRPALAIFLTAFVFFISQMAVAASNEPGVITGSRSILLTKIFNKGEIDWQVDENELAMDFLASDEEAETIVYENDGAAVYVFPYGGSVSPAQPTETAKPAAETKKGVQKYAVQRNDTLSKIAKNFGLKVETILWANGITEKTRLRQGDVLIVPAVDGVVYTVKSGGSLSDVSKKFNVSTKLLASANNLAANATLKKGQQLVVPGARQVALAETKPAATKPTPAAENPPATAPEPAPEENQPAEPAQPAEPVLPTPPSVISRPPLAAGAKLLWPTRRFAITQYFKSSHPGVDLDGDYSDPIYAADDGTVVSSGWNNSGYGNMILIDHGNGIVTRYGHASKVFVKAGQEVKRGDVIAMVGTTGRSTGSHLHFEVIISGRRVNPLKYIR